MVRILLWSPRAGRAVGPSRRRVHGERRRKRHRESSGMRKPPLLTTIAISAVLAGGAMMAATVGPDRAWPARLDPWPGATAGSAPPPVPVDPAASAIAEPG